MDYNQFYSVVYYEGTREVREEFASYEEAREFYESVEVSEDAYKVLQKVTEWENGEEYIDELEAE